MGSDDLEDTVLGADEGDAKNQTMVDRIAQTILYEGYLLYPYRASAVKNRQRFNFGVVAPKDYSDAVSGTESWTMTTECLIVGHEPAVRIRTRFLHLLHRQVEQFVWTKVGSSKIRTSQPVGSLDANQRRYQTWQEATEREVDSSELPLRVLCDQPEEIPFIFGSSESTEEICDEKQQPIGQVVRTQQAVLGMLAIEAVQLSDDLFRLQITIRNTTPQDGAESLIREQALLSSFASTHMVLTTINASFVSLLEPPAEFADQAAACQQLGCWPVLVGQNGDRQTMLVSPIILYDYPQIAEQSPGDFFDGTEIDEMLMLRVMTMTDEEKARDATRR